MARIDVQSIVRTGLHASFAPDAEPIVEINDSIGPPVGALGRTDFRAGGVVAVIAPHDSEMARGVGELAFFNMLYPCAENTNGHLMFFFARNRTGVAPDTPVLIDDKSVAHPLASTLLQQG